MSIALGLSAAAVGAAADHLRSVVRRTPLMRSERLSAGVGTSVWLKREDLQTGRSYKIRGAYHLISSVGPDERDRGVVCASAGNHAQGVAQSCSALGIRGQVFVPSTTPRQKRHRLPAIGTHSGPLGIARAPYDQARAAP